MDAKPEASAQNLVPAGDTRFRMKLDSKYFDSIRVTKGRGRGRADKPAAAAPRTCQWRGCTKPGPHKAPKGRDAEGEYYYFCRDHVVEYNKTYDYFAGMKDEDVADFQKSAATGHRPTWSMGVHGHDAPELHAARDAAAAAAASDPFELLKRVRGREQARSAEALKQRRAVSKGALKHLQALNLDETASPDDIKIQFKALVKLHHPDHNGGDRSSEDRFREVLAAYNYLKQSGLVR
ncbi:DnaJ domain-containing protein [Rhodomicrobium lacus]|uniref:DnaJ domain-containing protein n=2 Tax=Hyphomicrobiaceae TaxID=45401 RepID=UPI00315D7B78